MADHLSKFCLCFSPVCLVYAIVTIVSMVVMGSYYEKLPVSLVISDEPHPSQILATLDDWDFIPLTSLRVINGTEKCPDDHPEEVIYRQSPAIS